MSHLDEGTLHALIDGEISSQEIGAIQTHLAGCAQCRARLEEERQLAGDAMGLVELVELPAPAPVRTSVRGTPVPARGRRSWTRGLAWAASVIGAAGLGYAARSATVPELRISGTVSTPEPEARDMVTAPAESVLAVDIPVAPPKGAAAPAGASVAAANQARAHNAAVPERDEAMSDAAKPAPAPSPQTAAGLAAAAERPAFAQLKVAADSAEPVSFAEALQRLNGSIRLIAGMIPLGLEARGATVSVVYPGRILLVQELVNGRVVFRLIAPPGFPADSLERLRALVRD